MWEWKRQKQKKFFATLIQHNSLLPFCCCLFCFCFRALPKQSFAFVFMTLYAIRTTMWWL
jgi:hypothetical protein